MRLLVALTFLFISSLGHAAILVVNVYQPLAGKGPLTASYMQEAQGILREMGQQATYSVDLAGVYRFNMYFEDNESYGDLYQRLGSSATWAAFTAKISATPSATQIDNLILNEVKPGPAAQPGMVAEVTTWSVDLPSRNTFMQSALGAVPHHERQGAAGVSIWADAFNVYYITHHQNMRALGRFRDTPNPEFQRYFQEASGSSPGATMDRQTIIVTGR